MNTSLSFLESEPPENRVLKWLKQYRPALKDVENCEIDSGDSENEIDGAELTINVNMRNKIDVLQKPYNAALNEVGDCGDDSEDSEEEIDRSELTTNIHLRNKIECEPPENRVLKWLKQCSPAQKDDRDCEVDSRGSENEIDRAELTTNIHLRNKMEALQKYKRALKAVDDCKVTSGGSKNEISGAEVTTNVHLRNKMNVLHEQHSTKRQNDSFSTKQSEYSKPKHRKSSETDSGCLTSSTAWRVYTEKENRHILRYILTNNYFPFLKGTMMWQKMQKEKICDRSWESMKEHFTKNIYPNLEKYALDYEDKLKFEEFMEASSPKKNLHKEPGRQVGRNMEPSPHKDSGRHGGKKYITRCYTLEDDLIILKYILRKRRRLQVKGNSMWQTMEDKEILPGRSWYSIKARYFRAIEPFLKKHNVQDTDIDLLFEKGLISKKKPTDVSPPVLSCTNSANVVSRKSANQELRKYAIATGVHLASKLKLFKNTDLRIKPCKVILTDCSSMIHEASNSKTPAFYKHNAYERNEKNTNVNRKEVVCTSTCNLSRIVPDLEKDDASINVSMDQSDNTTEKSNESEGSVETSGSSVNSHESASISSVSQNRTLEESLECEGNEKNTNLNRKEVECPTPCSISRIGPVLQKDDASTLVPVDKNDSATQISDKSEGSVENSGSINSQESAVSQNRTLKYAQPLVESHSPSRNSEHSCNDRINDECVIPGLVSDLQESVVSVTEICDFRTPCTENHSSSEVNDADLDSLCEASELDSSFCSKNTVILQSPNRCVHSPIQNCVKCSSDHNLSPSSN